MSMFENSQFRWRETYFVLFDAGDRPTLKAVEQKISELNDRYELRNLRADTDGRFDSLTLLSPDDFAALDICYTSGAEVLEHSASLAEEMERAPPGSEEARSSKRVKQCDARFEVLHFEQIPEFPEEDDDPDEILDPSALLLVLGALAKITDGVALDPQAGAIISEDD